jgi:hypothetical protein
MWCLLLSLCDVAVTRRLVTSNGGVLRWDVDDVSMCHRCVTWRCGEAGEAGEGLVVVNIC